MSRLKDLAGRKFGDLAVIERVFPNDKYNRSMWLCKCKCGDTIIVRGDNLTGGNSTKCGSRKVASDGYSSDPPVARVRTRVSASGRSIASEYSSWCGMKDRCYNENNDRYGSYGGRGIVVCDRWRDSFSNFFEDMGTKPTNKNTIDRRDNNGNYEPNNCRWADASEQARNRSTTKVWVVYGMKFIAAGDAAMFYNVSVTTIRAWCGCVKDTLHKQKSGCYAYPKYIQQ